MRYFQIVPAKDRVQSWIVFGILSAFFVAAFIWQPSDNGIILCYFRALTGLPCPGCGLTRSLCAIAKGGMLRSFQYHIFGPLVFLIAVGFWGRAIAELIYHKTVTILISERIKRRLIPLFIIFLCLFWCFRIGYTLTHQTPESGFKQSLIYQFFTHHS
jgi:hypothetical protein